MYADRYVECNGVGAMNSQDTELEVAPKKVSDPDATLVLSTS